ncbi:MAG: hypothetical protein IJ772_04560 [Bacilli bacterium]|nr:hypothetical protein [Bacilli bacterium]
MSFRDYVAMDHVISERNAGKMMYGWVDIEKLNTQYFDCDNYYNMKERVRIEAHHPWNYCKEYLCNNGKVEIGKLLEYMTQSLNLNDKKKHLELLFKSLNDSREYYAKIRQKMEDENIDETEIELEENEEGGLLPPEQTFHQSLMKNRRVVEAQDIIEHRYTPYDLIDIKDIPVLINNIRFTTNEQLAKENYERALRAQEFKKNGVNNEEDDSDFIFGMGD